MDASRRTALVNGLSGLLAASVAPLTNLVKADTQQGQIADVVVHDRDLNDEEIKARYAACVAKLATKTLKAGQSIEVITGVHFDSETSQLSFDKLELSFPFDVNVRKPEPAQNESCCCCCDPAGCELTMSSDCSSDHTAAEAYHMALSVAANEYQYPQSDSGFFSRELAAIQAGGPVRLGDLIVSPRYVCPQYVIGSSWLYLTQQQYIQQRPEGDVTLHGAVEVHMVNLDALGELCGASGYTAHTMNELTNYLAPLNLSAETLFDIASHFIL